MGFLKERQWIKRPLKTIGADQGVQVLFLRHLFINIMDFMYQDGLHFGDN